MLTITEAAPQNDNATSSSPSLPDRRRFPRTGVNFDSNGMPVMDDDLIPFDMKRIKNTKHGRAAARKEAEQAYALWKDNDFLPVETGDDPGLCRGENSQYFDGDYPEIIDYRDANTGELAEHEMDVDIALADIAIAKAKRICSDCPIRVACLARSLTHEVRDRRGRVDRSRVAMDPYGVWGSWGPSAREVIFHQMIDVWQEDEEAMEEVDRFLARREREDALYADDSVETEVEDADQYTFAG